LCCVFRRDGANLYLQKVSQSLGDVTADTKREALGELYEMYESLGNDIPSSAKGDKAKPPSLFNLTRQSN